VHQELREERMLRKKGQQDIKNGKLFMMLRMKEVNRKEKKCNRRRIAE
jgi:hypothetical protein